MNMMITMSLAIPIYPEQTIMCYPKIKIPQRQPWPTFRSHKCVILALLYSSLFPVVVISVKEASPDMRPWEVEENDCQSSKGKSRYNTEVQLPANNQTCLNTIKFVCLYAFPFSYKFEFLLPSFKWRCFISLCLLIWMYFQIGCAKN